MADNKSYSSSDVSIVGGGVIGLSIARELAGSGLKVAIFDKGSPAMESSWAAAGMLAPQAEADSLDPFFQLAYESRQMFPEFVGRLREETGVDSELNRTGTLYLGFNSTDEREILHRYKWQTEAGLAVELLSPSELKAYEPEISDSVRLALRFPNDWQVENRRFCAALLRSAKLRVNLRFHEEVLQIQCRNGQVKGLLTSAGEHHSSLVIIAAGAWSSLLKIPDSPSPIPDIQPVRGQMIALDARPPLIDHVVYSPRGYLVPRADGRILAGSTTERVGYNKMVTADGLNQITGHALEILPKLAGLNLISSWSGLRPSSPDGLPMIGRSDIDGLYFATGHYRNGILLAPITASLLHDLLLKDSSSPLLSHFSPGRFKK
jgi:glycine oxidase